MTTKIERTAVAILHARAITGFEFVEELEQFQSMDHDDYRVVTTKLAPARRRRWRSKSNVSLSTVKVAIAS